MSSSLIDNYQCYIGCLHHSIGDEEFMTLAKCFSTNVVSTKLIRGQSASTHLGYGFVQYTDSSASDEAILLMQGVYSKGIPLVIRSTSNYTSVYTYDNDSDSTKTQTVNTTVHVSNLSDQDSQDSINDLAKPFGEIESINFIPDRKYCFVNFKRREYALGFLCHMDNWNTGNSVINWIITIIFRLCLVSGPCIPMSRSRTIKNYSIKKKKMKYPIDLLLYS